MAFIEMNELGSHQNSHGNSNEHYMDQLIRFFKQVHRNKHDNRK
jgi:hypothetical protein